MTKYYQGRFKPKNPSKYIGDVENIIYRSSWELAVCNYLDADSNVKEWVSEELVIPYMCQTDKKPHRYFMDFYVKYTNGKVLLIEVKPSQQTRPPSNSKGRPRAKVLQETLTYAKNESKWKATEEICKDRGWHFEIWTEEVLRSKGILPQKLGKKPFKPIKKMKPFRKPSRKK